MAGGGAGGLAEGGTNSSVGNLETIFGVEKGIKDALEKVQEVLVNNRRNLSDSNIGKYRSVAFLRGEHLKRIPKIVGELYPALHIAGISDDSLPHVPNVVGEYSLYTFRLKTEVNGD